MAQPHCHHHAVMGWQADAALLREAGADVQRLGGCCGLAGNWGVERGHHEVSVAVAETQLLPAVRERAPPAWCWPTASRAAPSSTTSRRRGATTSRSSSPATSPQ